MSLRDFFYIKYKTFHFYPCKLFKFFNHTHATLICIYIVISITFRNQNDI